LGCFCIVLDVVGVAARLVSGAETAVSPGVEDSEAFTEFGGELAPFAVSNPLVVSPVSAVAEGAVVFDGLPWRSDPEAALLFCFDVECEPAGAASVPTVVPVAVVPVVVVPDVVVSVAVVPVVEGVLVCLPDASSPAEDVVLDDGAVPD
jgi:hypothetical protein